MKLVRAQTNGTAIQDPKISKRKMKLICVLLASAAPRNAPTVQFERLTGSRSRVRMSNIKTDTNRAVKIAVMGSALDTSFPRIELDMLLPAIAKPANTPASVRDNASL